MIGIYARKKGMTQIFTEAGIVVPVTVLELSKTEFLERKGKERDGYDSALLATEPITEKKLSKPQLGQLKRFGKQGFKKLYEVRLANEDESIPDVIDASCFSNVSFVDVQGVGKGKGFQGVMKRHNFHGGRKTHGSKFHRAPGGTGMATFPGRTLKGTKLPGRMGGKKVTVQNIRIYEVRKEENLLLVQGSVPGARNSLVYVMPAKKKIYAS